MHRRSADLHVSRSPDVRVLRASDQLHMGMRPLIWTPGRWWAVIFSLAVAPFVFRYVELTGLQGYGLGWIVATVVLLARRS